MELVFHGNPEGGPAIELDHQVFSYAGKFRMTNTGKATITDDGSVVGAIAYSRDRTDQRTVWYRYITVRADQRGQGVGAQLAKDTGDHLLTNNAQLRIAVNNPFAFQSMYKAGFGFTGNQTGLSELVLERPSSQSADAYHTGLKLFSGESGPPVEKAFIKSHLTSNPPRSVEDGCR